MTHESDFSSRKRKGKKGEAFVDHLLQHVYRYRLVDFGELQNYPKEDATDLLVDVSEIPKYQRVSIDRLLFQADGSQKTLEIKTDYRALETKNLFFEIERQGVPTWGMKSQADYFVFLIPDRELLFVKPCKLRLLAWNLRTKLQEKIVGETSTVGLLIPIKTVQDNIASFHLSLQLKL